MTKTRDPRTGALAIEALHGSTIVPAVFPLEFDGTRGRWRLQLDCLPGASATHIPILQDGQVLCRLEVDSDHADSIELILEFDAEKGVTATTGRRLLVLPADTRHRPLPMIRPTSHSKLDLFFIIDGTTGVALESRGDTAADGRSLLLLNKEMWANHVWELVGLAEHLRREYADLRCGVLAFGDDPIDGFEAPDLIPAYRLAPNHQRRKLRTISREQLEGTLLTLEASPGGDLVDALADALEAARHVGWRDARRIVVVSGDSPGFSLTQTPCLPRVANGLVRRYDVDQEAAALHESGIEILTIYHPPEGNWSKRTRSSAEYTQDQYRRLASHPEIAFDQKEFDAATAAELLAASAQPIPRGPSLGVFRAGVAF